MTYLNRMKTQISLVRNFLLVISAAGSIHQCVGSLIINGSFEDPVTGHDTDIYYAGEQFYRWEDALGNLKDGPGAGVHAQYYPGWAVQSGSVDVIRDDGLYRWQTIDGHRCIDLAGSSDGAIYQDISTTPGATYQLSFALAGNPAPSGPRLKQLRLLWDGTLVDDPTFDVTGKTPSSMGWETLTYSLTASSTTTRLVFQSVGNGINGPALDNVSVISVGAVPEPSTFIAGALCLLPFGLQGIRYLRNRR